MAGEHRSCDRKDVKMGRSKFPGRPSKIPNRRRVNLSNCELPEHNDSSKAAENICRGLFVFNETFGDSGLESTSFNGFSPSEVDEAIVEARLQQKEAETEFKKHGLPINLWSDFQEELSSIFHLKPSRSLKTKKTNVCFDGGGKSEVTMLNELEVHPVETPCVKSDENSKALTTISPCRSGESVVSKERQNGVVKRARRKLLLQSPKSKSLQSQAAKKLLKKAKVNIIEVGKTGLEKKFVLPSRSAHSSRVIKPNKRFLEVSDQAKIKLELVNSQKAQETAMSSDNKASSTNGVAPRAGSKVILREARLQLDSTPSSLGEGPFSSPSAVSLAPAQPRVSTVLCGICGVVRSDKFVRKFGVLSCESCRKFIARIIRRRTSLSEAGLKCLKGTGMCMSSPAVWTSPQVANLARCQACWLKTCLRNFQIPAKLKSQLQLLLPTERKNDTVTPTLADANLFPVPDGQLAYFNGFAGISKKPKSEPLNDDKERKPVEKKVLKKEKSKKDKEKNGKKREGKRKARQRIPLPGPRVKHVCRSASVALGQPIAIFGDRPAAEDCCEDDPPKPSLSSPENVVTVPTPTKPSSPEPVSNVVETKQTKPSAPAVKPPGPLQSVRNKKAEDNETSHLISMDFWEIYDPDEVCETGLSLIGSEPFSVRALCFLCGSAGLQKMVHCACCCEPYHEFCVSDNQVKADVWRYDWVCPRCTLCATCGKPSGQQLKCIRCENSYHSECVGGRQLHSPDRPWVCSACLRCKSCSATEVSVFVGNLPLCKLCFALRQRGNYCPLCQRCYEDDDYECKMMECGMCQSWVHAKCEGVSDEKYQVLSFLPESVEFICRMCCVMPPAPWWLAVEAELKAGYLGVLKALSKNRTACRMLKWSPRKICSCRRRESLKLTPEEDSPDSPAPASDSGVGSTDDEFKLLPDEEDCFCFLEVDSYNSRSKPFSPNLLYIKKKVTTNEYSSLAQFHEDMQSMFETTQSEELIEVYHSVIKEVFPWFDPKGVRVLGASRSGSLENTPIKSSPVKSSPALPCLVPVSDIMGKPLEYFYNDDGIVDTRVCLLCKTVGDGPSDDTGRLLYCGQNEWVHCNCALWSGEVFEEIDGSLQNVHSAISRGRGIKCPHCQLRGASVGCCARSCTETYHFSCARSVGCIFLDDKSVYCRAHSSETSGRLLQNEKDFELRRPVYVELDKRRSKPVEVTAVRLAVGGFHMDCIGLFVPEVSDLPETIMPSGFQATRLFWSSKEPWRLVRYRFTVSCVEPELAEGVDLGVNLTIDHSRSDLDARLRQLKHFQLNHTLLPLEPPRPAKRIKRRVFDPLDEADNQDLLPPDIEEAILKELSHDMLEGISVQDIFQDISERERDEEGQEDELTAHPRPRKTAMLRSGNWNSKADKQEKGETKWKRKTQEGKENKMVGWCARLLQVDGSVDSSSGSEAGESPGRSAEMPSDIPQLDGAEDSDYESCDGLPDTDEAPVECGTCRCTYRTQRSYERHLESRCHDLLLSSSEEEEEPSPPPPPPSNKPVKPRTYARKKPVAIAAPPAPAPAPPVIIPPSPVPVILQEVPSYQPVVQYIMEPQKQLLVPSAYQVVLPPSPVVLGTSSPMFEVVTDPNTGGMFLAQQSHQPVLYNMETIVSNTVMQTNQFVSSSYSQTSTQVFQASKLEQVVNMPTGYVLAPSDLICVPVTPPMAPPPVRAQWTPPKPKALILKQEIPPSRPTPSKVKPRSRALVDYINNFRSDIPDVPCSVSDNNPTIPPVSTPISFTGSLHSSTVYSTVSASLPPSTTSAVPVQASLQSNHRRPSPVATVRKVASVLPMRMPPQAVASNKVASPRRTVAPTMKPTIPSLIKPIPSPRPIMSSQPLRKPTPPPPALSISMPSLDDSPPVSCDNSPALPSSMSLNLPMPLVQTSATSTTTTLPVPSKPPVYCFPSSPLQRSMRPEPVHAPNLTSQSFEIPVTAPSSPQLCLSPSNSLLGNPPSPFLSPRPSSSHSSPLHSLPSFTPPIPTSITSTINSTNCIQPAYQSPQRSPLATHSLSSPRTSPFQTNHEPLPSKSEPQVSPVLRPQATAAQVVPTLKQNIPVTPIRQDLHPSSASSSPLSLPPPRLPGQNQVRPLASLQPPSTLPMFKKFCPSSDIQNKPCLKELKITPRIVEPEGPKLVYDVVADDGFKFSSTSLSEVWQKICESVQEMRAANRMPALPMTPRGYEVLATNNHGLQHLLEQLPGVGYCKKYQPKYFKQHRSSEEDLPLKENLTGCARCEGYCERKECGTFGWLASRHRKLPRIDSSQDEGPSNRRTHNLPMAMRYRQLRESSKKDMCVFRSKIHGMGLFCLREIEAGEMVIEYSGELIRSALTDKREKMYTDKGIGCYMFRIDDHFVVDATINGNAARFINHSCEPNCYSKVVDILGKKHIIIFALRRINTMEELTYDYKFPIEDVKISCHCLSKKCRKYLN